MRLLTIFAVLAICAAVQLNPAIANEDWATTASARSVSAGLTAIGKFGDLVKLAGNVFDSTSTTKFGDTLASIVGIAFPLIDLIIKKPEDPTLVEIRKQFKNVNSKLDGIDLNLREIKRLIQWTSTLSQYRGYESAINVAYDDYKNYVAATRSSSRDTYKREFMDHFRGHLRSAEYLYNGIMNNPTLGSNLGKAVMLATGNHRKQVQKFLIEMTRLIVRGSQLHVAYSTLNNDRDPSVIANDWKRKLKSLATEIKRFEDRVKAEVSTQFKDDTEAKIYDFRRDSNKDFSKKMYDFLNEKFDWLNWIALAYNDVSGDDKHYVRQNGAAVFNKVNGGRNVVVAMAEKSSRWSKSTAERTLGVIKSRGDRKKSAKFWNDHINTLYPVSSRTVRLIAVVCWGCDFWFTAKSSNRAYEYISGGYSSNVVTAVLFG